jgi:hypothetical protein
VLAGAAWPLRGSESGAIGESQGEAGVLRWRGLIATRSVTAVLAGLRQQCRDKQIPWAAVVVRGSDDDIVQRGENNYLVFIHPGGDSYWAFAMSKNFLL